MQTDLQVLLLIVGAVFSLYVIFSLFRRSTQKNSQEPEEFGETVIAARKYVATDRDPLLEDGSFLGPARVASASKQKMASEIVQEIDDQQSANAHQQEYSQNRTDENQSQLARYIAITVLAKNPNGFVGSALQNTLRSNHFHYHKQGVFNRHVNDNPTMPVMFSVLSLREPGIFDMTMDNLNFEGIVFLLVLQNNNNPSVMFEKMLTSARQLAVMLDGELCDDKHQPLNAHTMARIREKIQESHRRTLTR